MLKNNKREKKFGGKPLIESKDALNKIVNNTFIDKVYGQQIAKKQSHPIVKKTMHNIETTNREKMLNFGAEVNVVYMIGPSGVGKTTMAQAIANAVLKYPEKTFLKINTGTIESGVSLATQLFKTVDKKNIGFENRKTSDFDNGIYSVESEASIFDHALRWNEAIVLIDDYDKMKKMALKESDSSNYNMQSDIAKSNGLQK